MAMLNLATVKPVVDGIIWLASLGAAEIRQVKDETQELLRHLARSLKSLWEVTREVTKLSDESFKSEFPGVYDYFKRFYYDLDAFEGARTHCSDLKRDIGRITFRLAVFLRTDIGKWSEAYQQLNLGLLDDAVYMHDYRENYELLNTRLNEISELHRQGKDQAALEAYRVLRSELSGDLDHLNNYIDRMRKSDTHVREIVG